MTSNCAENGDVRRDLPLYRVYADGALVDEPVDIMNRWTKDMVAILFGCSFSFEEALIQHGLSIRNIEEGKNVPMYQTNIPCVPAGKFHGFLVVSMRPFNSRDCLKAIEVTSKCPKVHGAPVHLGNPTEIGIEDLDSPDWGDAVTVHSDEVSGCSCF